MRQHIEITAQFVLRRLIANQLPLGQRGPILPIARGVDRRRRLATRVAGRVADFVGDQAPPSRARPTPKETAEPSPAGDAPEIFLLAGGKSASVAGQGGWRTQIPNGGGGCGRGQAPQSIAG
jgi:hypothetical protein